MIRRCFLVIICVSLSGCPKKTTPPVEPLPVKVNVVQLSELRNLGLAYVENEELDKSYATFSQLIELVPSELMPLRNLGVSTTMAINMADRSQPEILAQAKSRFLQTMNDLKEKDTSEIPMLLSALGHASLQQNDTALKELNEAVKRNPESATAWFHMFTVAALSSDDQTKVVGQDAIREAYRLAPSNLIVLVEWLLVQAGNEDPTIVETLTNSEDLLGQLAPGLKTRVRIDIRDFIQAAKDAATENKWSLVQRNVQILKNVIQPDDAAQSDRRDIVQHPLDYLIDHFKPDIEDEIVAAQTKDVSSVDVTFELSKLELENDAPIHAAKFADVDLDQKVEIVLLQQNKLSVLSNGDWKEVASVDVPKGRTQIVVSDLENDDDTKLIPKGQELSVCHTTDLEIVAYGESGVSIFQTQLSLIGGEITLTPFELKGGIAELKNVQKVSVSDLNNDGDLDLLIISDNTISMWSNRGELQFEKFSPSWTIPETVSDCVAVDYDHDVDTDVVVLLNSGKLGLLENLRHGTFRWKELEVTVQSIHPEIINITDYNRDGEWDLMLAGENKGIVLTTAISNEWSEIPLGLLGPLGNGKSLQFFDWDYDNDGFRDLVHVSSNLIDINRHSFKDDETTGMSMSIYGTDDIFVGCDVSDIDRDGDDDVLFVSNQKLSLKTNMGGNQNHWIDVELLAKQLARGGTSASGRVNMYGIGSVIEVRSGVTYQKQQVMRERTRFGLGTHKTADAVRVLWTNGVPANIVQPKADQLVCERQSLKGSCPYLYTWNGDEFVFVTDLLWASPIGLQDANGQLVPARHWEYLKIPGEMLVPKAGKYQLQITEELWEVAYFDQSELIAIDHPAEIDIFSNEKVGPPSIAEFKIHSVKQRRHPLSVVNQAGEDLLSLVNELDDQYAKPFDAKIRQGYTTDSWLEIDLGLSDKPKNLKLYLTGWIYPTDTSINASLNESSTLSGPRPPSISVPNENGEFVEVVPFTGFPGGKTKTIVIELGDIFLSDDYRLRLSTSSELYWDEIFFNVQEDAAHESEIVQTPLKLLSADLHNREVSVHVDHPNFGPERFLYNETETLPPWPPISGNFTRFGDVQSLIADADDRMVIMGSGEEMTLTFAVPTEPLKPGWKRDFILHNIGWDKDADLHTVYGTTVAPLPFRAMKQYPYGHDEEFPTTTGSQTYQTRQLNPLRYRHSLKHAVHE